MRQVSIVILLVLAALLAVDASVRICNHGGYLAKCFLESRSLSFGYRNRRQDTGFFAVTQCATLDIPVDAVWNGLECKELVFFGIYKSIFRQEFASSTYNYCYEITGTTLMPRWSQTSC